MSTAIHGLLTGTFTSNATPRFISLPSGYDEFELVNITDIGDAGATTQVMRAHGYSSLPAGSAYLNLKTNGAATLAIESMITTNGFTFVQDTGIQTPGAAVAVTAITAASPAVVSSASTAAVGDVIRLYGTTGMLQIGGWDFTVSAVNPGVTQSINNLIAAGFAAPATAGFVRIIPFHPRYYPPVRRITAITQGASTIIALNVTHFYTVGQQVRISMPAGWGMPEINGLLGTITAVGTAVSTSTNTITVDIDSTTFTAFAFPTTAVAALGTGAPEVIPVGEAAINTIAEPYANLLDDATRNVSVTGVIVGTGVQTTAKLYQWIARRGQSI
jgi:hypothetical protein